LNIQINVLIIQRTTCLHFQRSTLSKPGTPSEYVDGVQLTVDGKPMADLKFISYRCETKL